MTSRTVLTAATATCGFVLFGAAPARPSLSYFHQTDKGGHFAAWEQPELFAAEMRAAFRSLRSSSQSGR